MIFHCLGGSAWQSARLVIWWSRVQFPPGAHSTFLDILLDNFIQNEMYIIICCMLLGPQGSLVDPLGFGSLRLRFKSGRTHCPALAQFGRALDCRSKCCWFKSGRRDFIIIILIPLLKNLKRFLSKIIVLLIKFLFRRIIKTFIYSDVHNYQY